MKINPSIFRKYDIRGKYPQELSQEAAYRIAQAFCLSFPFAEKLVIARDPRLSSPFLKQAIERAFLEAGRTVIDIGIAPDPLLYFAIFNYNLDGGIMISGSHNPKEYNGLTLNVRSSSQQPEDVIDQELAKIKDLVFSDKDLSLPLAPKGEVIRLDPTEDYIKYVSQRIKINKPLKIVIDVGNGACGYLPEMVFRRLGCEAKTLFAEFDGTFPYHLPDPYKEENLEAIKKEIKENGADIGFAFDTDGDRVGPIDKNGRFINGDLCFFILAKQALQKKKGPVVHDMRISLAFLEEMEKEGVKTYFSVSHHNAIIKKILETNAVFGGEITLHFLFPLDYYLCDDALFSALKIAEIASAMPDFVSYLDQIPRYFSSPEIFISCPDEEKFAIIENLRSYLRKNNYHFIDVDGARINFENGWALARASNTTPIIKCRFEGKTKKDLQEIEKKALKIFKEVGIPIDEKVYQELGLVGLDNNSNLLNS